MSISKDKKLAEKNIQLQQQLASSKNMIKVLKKEKKSLEDKLLTSEGKRKLLKDELSQKKRILGTISLQPIERHQFSEFIVSLCVLLYMRTKCGLRGVVTIVSILKELLKWDLDIPSHATIANWIIKSGLSIYKEPVFLEEEDEYAVITDESMMVGSQKMLLTLGVKAQHEGRPLSHSDVKVLGINVRSSWNAQWICTVLKNISTRLKRLPSYVISDNASVMNKGIRDSDITHIRDISHTLGMFMERVYKKCDQFNDFMKDLSQVKFKEVMTPVAYLLPPKQRTIARFMNLSNVVDWSEKILRNYTNLTALERKTFSFIPQYASLIEELRTVLTCINSIEHEVKHNGLSLKTLKNCIKIMKPTLFIGNERMTKISEQILNHFRDEVRKLPSSKTCWNASSDIVESFFGTYKSKKSPNSLYGVTSFVLFLPLQARIGKKVKITDFDFKNGLESVFMADIEQWKKENLFENQVSKRIQKLNAA
jgi:hypothetical protein